MAELLDFSCVTSFTLHVTDSYHMLQKNSWVCTRSELPWDLTAVQLENKKSLFANFNKTEFSLLEDCVCLLLYTYSIAS